MQAYPLYVSLIMRPLVWMLMKEASFHIWVPASLLEHWASHVMQHRSISGRYAQSLIAAALGLNYPSASHANFSFDWACMHWYLKKLHRFWSGPWRDHNNDIELIAGVQYLFPSTYKVLYLLAESYCSLELNVPCRCTTFRAIPTAMPPSQTAPALL